MHAWKRSLPVANVANLVERHVVEYWPDLVRHPVPGLWFTGSRVWRILYPDLVDLVDHADPRGASATRDWDIFALADDPARELVDLLGLDRCPACRTSEKHERAGRPAVERTVSCTHVPVIRPDVDASYDDGFSYLTPRGDVVDLWVSTLGTAAAELRDYPAASHAHCRAAFSLEDGLVVLPNEVVSTRGPRLIAPGPGSSSGLLDLESLDSSTPASPGIREPRGPVVDMAEEWAP